MSTRCPSLPLFKDVVELFARSKTAYTPTLLVLYGGPWAENYFYTTTEVHDDPKLNRFVPHNEIDRISKRRPWFRMDEHTFPRIAAQVAKIQRAGGLVGVGGHGQLQGLGYHWEMWSLAMGGMTPQEVLFWTRTPWRTSATPTRSATQWDLSCGLGVLARNLPTPLRKSANSAPSRACPAALPAPVRPTMKA